MGKDSKKIEQKEPESDEEVALDDDDVEEAVLDEDAVPKRKVEIDNTVRLFLVKYDDPIFYFLVQ